VVERGTPYTSILLMVEKEYILHVHTAEPIFLDNLWPFTQGIPWVFWPNTLESPRVAHFSIFRRFFSITWVKRQIPGVPHGVISLGLTLGRSKYLGYVV
jgi:hypothetical protein